MISIRGMKSTLTRFIEYWVDLAGYTYQANNVVREGTRGIFDYRDPTQLAIIEAYGLDVDSRRDEIQACRKSVKRIEELDLHPESDEGDLEGPEL